jgi:hypothetical protein
MTEHDTDRSSELDHLLRQALAPNQEGVRRLAAHALAAPPRPHQTFWRPLLVCTTATALLALAVTVVVRGPQPAQKAQVATVFSAGTLVVATAPGQSLWIVSPGAKIDPTPPTIVILKGEPQ